MEITSVGAYGSYTPVTTNSAKESNSERPLIELTDIKKLDLPQSTLFRMEMTIKLQNTIKTQAINSQDANVGGRIYSPTYEDLASAYDQVRKELNENSENSNKHGKFLDDAFADLVRFYSSRNAEQISMNVTGSPKNSATIDGVNPFVASAEKQAEIFSSTFLKEYKKNGLDSALTGALNALNNMPETTSLFNISYKDFKALNTKSLDFLLLSADTVNDLLTGSDLSDYMKGILSKSYDNYKANHNGYGLSLLMPDKALRLDTIA